MRKLAVFLLIARLAAAAGAGPSDSAAPQTARQALLEMFFSKSSGTLVKHLPAATVSALQKGGALDSLQQYSLLAGQLHSAGGQFETFETGSILLSFEDPKAGQKVEVVVENDSLNGEQDDLELTFQTYKEKVAQHTPYMPRVTFSMKMESGVWKLNEISVSVRVGLADPDFLKTISEGMKKRATAAGSASSPVRLQSKPFPGEQFQSKQWTGATPASSAPGADASVLAAMRTIVNAEKIYRATYGSVGFTCTISDLDGFGGGEPNEHQAMLIPSTLASGRKFGFVFSLSGCSGSGGGGFELTAAPVGTFSGRKAFCGDQSGAIRASEDGSAATCLAGGSPVP